MSRRPGILLGLALENLNDAFVLTEPKWKEKMPDFKPEISFDDFVKVDLRVAKILEAELHPNADKLLKLKVDDGTEGGRQICAGIKAYYSPEDLVGKSVVIVANLAPREIRGEISNGMVVAASSGEKGDADRDVVVLTPMSEIDPGSVVS